MKSTMMSLSVAVALLGSPLLMADPVNINTADVAALDILDGVGLKKAEAIVAYRTEHGEFKTLDALKDVPGIGDGIFDKVKPDIRLSDDPAPVDSAMAEQKPSGATASATASKGTGKAEDKDKAIVDADKAEKPAGKTATAADQADKAERPEKAEKAARSAKADDKISHKSVAQDEAGKS